MHETEMDEAGFQLFCGVCFLLMSMGAHSHCQYVCWAYPDTFTSARGVGPLLQRVYGISYVPAIPPWAFLVVYLWMLAALLSGACGLVGYRAVAAQCYPLLLVILTQLSLTLGVGGHAGVFLPHVWFYLMASPSLKVAIFCGVSTLSLNYFTSGVHKILAPGEFVKGEVTKWWVYENIWLCPVPDAWRDRVRRAMVRSQWRSSMWAMNVAVLVLELTMPLTVPLAPLAMIFSSSIFHLCCWAVLDLDWVTYFWTAFLLIVPSACDAALRGSLLLPWDSTDVDAFLTTALACFGSRPLGTGICAAYFVLHVFLMITLQDLTLLPFSSLDVFSESPTFFDKHWPISVVCSVPIPEKQVPGLSAPPTQGQSQMVQIPASEVQTPRMVANVVISKGLSSAVEAWARALRVDGRPGDEWDVCMMDTMLSLYDRVRAELAQCSLLDAREKKHTNAEKLVDHYKDMENPVAQQRTVNLYDAWSTSYDADLRSWGYQVPRMLADTLASFRSNGFTPSQPLGGAVLDFACGTGLIGEELSSRGYGELHGCDISPESLQEAQKKGFYSSLEVVDMNLHPYPYADKQFKHVICGGSLAYATSIRLVLTELVRLTCPGGLIIASYSFDSAEIADVPEEVMVAIGALAKEGILACLHTSSAKPYGDVSSPIGGNRQVRIFVMQVLGPQTN